MMSIAEVVVSLKLNNYKIANTKTTNDPKTVAEPTPGTSHVSSISPSKILQHNIDERKVVL
jgi:hypothetical protein